jgi:hypothetical protein
MLQRYSMRLQIYSWSMKYCHPNWRLRASSLFFNGDVGRRQHRAVSITWRNGRFELNFLTFQDRPKHTSRGYSKSHVRLIPSILLCGTASPPSSTAARQLCTRHYLDMNEFKMVGSMFWPQFNPVLKLTDYRILGIWLVCSNA